MSNVYTTEVDVSYSTSGDTMIMNVFIQPKQSLQHITIPLVITSTDGIEEIFGKIEKSFEQIVAERKEKIKKILNEK